MEQNKLEYLQYMNVEDYLLLNNQIVNINSTQLTIAEIKSVISAGIVH